MKVSVLVLALISSAAAVLDPRGARPVVPNTRSEKCATQKEWPFCTDDEWGPKCPSGCRIHGLLEQYDHDFLKRIERIRDVLDQNKAKHRTAEQITRQTFDFLREKLTLSSGNDNNYLDMAQTLRQRITDMKIRIDQQLQVLGALKGRVKDQVADMVKLEVDIDMKLRTCKGSCKAYNSYEVDHQGHVALEKQMNQLDMLANQNVEFVGTLHVMKSRPLKDAVVDSIYKSKDPQTAQQKTEDIFPEVKTVQLFLEEEGSSSSPATISKVTVCQRLNQNDHQSLTKNRWMNHCGGETHLPMCTDQDWVSSCPSGCRIQGLILEHEKKVESKLRNICKMTKTYKDATQKTMATTARLYHVNREHIMNAAALQVRFVKLARDLTRNLTSLWNQSKSLELKITELKEKVQKQVEELLRTEVEVDMRVRSCLGSCQSSSSLSVNLEDYTALGSEMEKMHNKERKSKTVKPEMIPQIRTAPVDFGPDPSPVYKTIKTVLDEGLNLFEDLRPNQLEFEDIYDSSELE